MTDVWASHERVVGSFDELTTAVTLLARAAKVRSRIIAWRGQANASWALTSKLYRNLSSGGKRPITESGFSKEEREILVRLREWGLHSQKFGGRLSVLSQLAMLQHFGTPTRLIDITFNALVGAFFATEEKHEEHDARLFAVDVTNFMINDDRILRHWEDSLDTPWSDSYINTQFNLFSQTDKLKDLGDPDRENFRQSWLNEWCSHYFAWKPPALDARIAAQNSGFLFGGIVGSKLREGFLSDGKPVKAGSFQVSNPGKDADTRSWLSIDEVRKFTCLAIKPQPFPESSIRANTRNAAYSIRIKKECKEEIREYLRSLYGYTHATIYPDFTGFASFGSK